MALDDQTRQMAKLSFMIGITFAFFLCELIVGHVTNSLALIGDSYHMISDVLALIIGLACLAISTRSSKQNTFGWARAEILGALVNSVFLAALCFTIFIEAIQRIIAPHRIENPHLLLIVGSVGLLVNILGLIIFYNETHGHSHGGNLGQTSSKEGKKVDRTNVNNNSIEIEEITDIPTAEEQQIDRKGTNECPDVKQNGERHCTLDQVNHLTSGDSQIGNHNENHVEGYETKTTAKKADENAQNDAAVTISDLDDLKVQNVKTASQMNIKGVFLHIMGDALGSIVVIASALVAIFIDSNWVTYVDPALSIFIVIIILSTTYPLLRQSALILIQHVPDHIRITELSKKLCSEIEGILGIHELHIWQLVGNRIIASVHVKCKNADEYKILSVKIKEVFHDEGIHSTTIQPEFVEDQDGVLEKCSMECGGGKSCENLRCCKEIKKAT